MAGFLKSKHPSKNCSYTVDDPLGGDEEDFSARDRAGFSPSGVDDILLAAPVPHFDVHRHPMPACGHMPQPGYTYQSVVVINTLSFRGQNMFCCCCCCGAAQLLGVTTAHGNRGGPNDDVYGPRKHNTNMESAVTFARHRNHHAAAKFIFGDGRGVC
jgi:hypothetical protein